MPRITAETLTSKGLAASTIQRNATLASEHPCQIHLSRKIQGLRQHNFSFAPDFGPLHFHLSLRITSTKFSPYNVFPCASVGPIANHMLLGD